MVSIYIAIPLAVEQHTGKNGRNERQSLPFKKTRNYVTILTLPALARKNTGKWRIKKYIIYQLRLNQQRNPD